jgi:proline dehydrogenase
MRDFFLFLAKNKTLTRLAKKYGLRFGAGRFVAGATLESSIAAIKKLNEKGMPVTIDHLGEFVDNEKEAAEMTDHCIQAIKAIAKEKLDSQLSLKMTSMGLDISDELVLSNMRKIMDEATKHNVMITIDMEDYTRCGKTIEIFKQLKSEYDNISTVIQAYLYRSLEDVQSLNEYQPNLRLVKGAYKEPAKVAYPEKSDVDKNFERLIETHMLNGNYTAVATHDDEIIRFTKELVDKHSIPYDQFEFQMLYGIRVERQEQLLQEGYKMRIYVPYGNDWYGYFMRRLAERPANVLFVLKGVFGK